MKHTLHKCDSERCYVCNGGLAFCEVCKGGEASLTTECCGQVLTNKEEDAIMAKKLDFKNGEWQF